MAYNRCVRTLLPVLPWLVASWVSGKDPGYSVPILNEAGLPGTQTTYSARALKTGQWGVAGQTGLSWDPSLVENRLLADSVQINKLIQTGARMSISAGLGAGVDAALSLPVYYEYWNEQTPGQQTRPAEAGGLGDLSALASIQVPWRVPTWAFAFLVTGSLPTSTSSGLTPREMGSHPVEGVYPSRDAHPYGLKLPRAGAGGAMTLDFTRWTQPHDLVFHLNLMEDRPFFSDARNELGTFTAAFAVEWKLSSQTRLQAEFRHERLLRNPTPWESSLGEGAYLGLGLALPSESGFCLRVGGRLAPERWNPRIPLVQRFGLVSRGLAYRRFASTAVYLAVSHEIFFLLRDKDMDGIPDIHDDCPWKKEDANGFMDQDGCPDTDEDRDGIPDVADRCPAAVEDRDGFQDKDGCPDFDNDRDSIPDAGDACPNDSEDRDGFEDSDGCPDMDNDHDGTPDAGDKCPMAPENRNGVEDGDGCPELDIDRDGILDIKDSCPTEAEIVNFYQDGDGCPDEKPPAVVNGVLTGVVFLSGSAQLHSSAEPALEELANRLLAYPGTEIEIQGHVDNLTGNPHSLSLSRAEAVAAFLVSRRVETRRLKVVGYGSLRPVATNRTAKGREANRRIEIKRLN